MQARAWYFFEPNGTRHGPSYTEQQAKMEAARFAACRADLDEARALFIFRSLETAGWRVRHSSMRLETPPKQSEPGAGPSSAPDHLTTTLPIFSRSSPCFLDLEMHTERIEGAPYRQPRRRWALQERHFARLAGFIGDIAGVFCPLRCAGAGALPPKPSYAYGGNDAAPWCGQERHHGLGQPLTLPKLYRQGSISPLNASGRIESQIGRTDRLCTEVFSPAVLARYDVRRTISACAGFSVFCSFCARNQTTTRP